MDPRDLEIVADLKRGMGFTDVYNGEESGAVKCMCA